MSGFSRVRTQRRELLASGRLFGLRRSGGALVPAFSRVTVQTAGVPAEAKRMVVSASGDLYLSSAIVPMDMRLRNSCLRLRTAL